MTTIAWAARALALAAAGALAVHAVRYAVAHPAHGSEPLPGHAYLAVLTPVLVAVLVVAMAGVVHRLADGAWATPRSWPFWRLWAAAAAAILAIHLGQECAEALLAAGHPIGLDGMFGHGAWAAALAAAGAGLPIALALRGEAAAARLRPALGAALRPRRSAAPLGVAVSAEAPRRRFTGLCESSRGPPPLPA